MSMRIVPTLLNGVRNIVTGIYQPVASIVNSNQARAPLTRFTQILVQPPLSNEVQLTNMIVHRVGEKINSENRLGNAAINGLDHINPHTQIFLTVLNFDEIGRFPKSVVQHSLHVNLTPEVRRDFDGQVEEVYDQVISHLRTQSSYNTCYSVNFPAKVPFSTSALLQDLIFRQVSLRLNGLPHGRYFARSEIQPLDHEAATRVDLLVTKVNS